MEYLKENKKILLAFLLGIVIGFEGSWLVLRGRERPQGPVSSRVSNADNGENAKENEEGEGNVIIEEQSGAGVQQPVMGKTSAEGNAIITAEQEAGMEARLETLMLEKTGWVAVYEDERGRPGKILGAQRFPSGEHRSVSVELLRAMIPGAVYYAMLHEDDGVDAFDYTKDIPITSSSGPLMTRFETTP